MGILFLLNKKLWAMKNIKSVFDLLKRFVEKIRKNFNRRDDNFDNPYLIW